MKIPSQITAGDSISWDDVPSTDNLGNQVDSSLWTLKYDFRQAGATNLTVTSAAQGLGWRTTLTKIQTSGFASGKVYFQAYAESGTDRVTLGAGSFTIEKNVSTAANTDEFRSQAEQDLAAVETAIRSLVSGGAKAYTIGGRSMTKNDMADLLMWRDRLKGIVAKEKKAERLANGLGNPSNVFVRFQK